MNAAQEPIAPDVVQVLMAKATASGLSINDYLRHLLGLNNEQSSEPAASELGEKAPQPNDAKLTALQRIAERQAKRPFTKSADTLKMLREARAGAMWGYEPNE